MSRILALTLLTLMFSMPAAAEWYKGNTHTHTTNSGGDSTQGDVVKWYRENGYNFLFITDHKMVTNVDALNALYGCEGQFLVIAGEEVSSNLKRPTGNIYVHVNSLDPRGRAEPASGLSVRDTLQRDIDAIRAAGGLAQINHPNFMWQLHSDDIAAVHGARLLEIMNMNPLVNSHGAGAEFPSGEQLWDQVLSLGKILWGVASDDMHNIKPQPPGEDEGSPGQGWIEVRADHLTTADIMHGIEEGDFYASTGIELIDYTVEHGQITIRIKQGPYQTKYRTQFIGMSGKILQDGTANPAVYRIKGNEGYVRARIDDSNGKMAWTQPVFVQSSN